ncbi:MAG: glucokinase [Paracoccus sp. (in: a-proteobacteria)]|uniref:glucokinase n=1 Tax=Paracoccus sp. TaxID=267 RepID=UPI0026E03BC7|nr:glucokinase [Paracoccus sp. (in: a-proteobacteria)]MDO5632568.1 glucokinase [Paracoccus sp. (in: a-proteobacteria)]
MAMLLADVGGTNARLALAQDGRIIQASLSRYRGDDHASFDEVVQDFLAQQGQPRITALCVAVAGPVGGGRAALTNRDWSFSETGLARLTGADQARLINDLTALGYATARLAGDGVQVLRPAPDARARNGQALVVGAGTGVNVCAVYSLPRGGVICLEAEEGHTRLPAHIMARLETEIGPQARKVFFSTEEAFAGRGLSQLHALRTGTPVLRAEQIVAAAEGGDEAATATCDLFAELLGLLCRELVLRFMPQEGLYLAGSVARSMAGRMAQFEAGFLAEPLMRHIPQATPVLLIRDDMAALHGCLAALA